MIIIENAKPFNNSSIPDDWNLEFLGKYGTAYSGLSGKTKEDFGFGKPYIPYLNIFSNAIICDGVFDFVNVLENESQTKVQNGDLFFTTSSETPEEVGMCSVYLGDERELYLNSFCFGFRPNDVDEISTEFLAQLFRSQLGRKIVFKLAQGATRYNISKTSILNTVFPLPPLPEQKAIAKALSLMDTAINLNNQLIAQKELRKKWLMQNLLTGKLRLKGFNGEWKEYFINKLFEKVHRYIKWDEKTTYNLVSIKRRYGGLFFRGDLLGENISVKKLKSIQEGDFLISKRQVSHGAWVVVTKEFDGGKVSDEYDCLKISNNKILNADFWKWYCQQRIMTHYAYLDSIGVHIEKLIFHYSLFKKRKVRIPDTLEEQIAIAKVLQAADKEIALLKAKTDKLREQKKGMMQVLLTGKKRLKVE